MKIPLSWLKKYINTKDSPQKIGEMLTSLGIEVDAIENISPSFENVVVAKVLGVKRHPSADRLQIADVWDGVQSFQVVCGAPNCREGIKVAFARVGSSVGGEKLKQAKLRGVDSFGMLCSGTELGVSEEGDKILEFQDHLTEGTDLSKLYSDTVLEVSLTPNLGHCSSVLGVARELSAATSLPVCLPDWKLKETDEKTDSFITLDVQDSSGCPHYACRVIRNVSIVPSPEWLQEHLRLADLRPVNLVVDVTNYIQHELGHPMHAFDLDAISGNKIVVASAKEGANFETLDGKERILSSEDLIIADAEKPIALAGVMGGSSTQVNEKTVNILLESASFDPKIIRKTSKRHSLQTESSRRFERGVDPQNVRLALDRAAAMIAELGGGSVAKGVVESLGKPFVCKKITCRLNRVQSLLGVVFSVGEVEEVFKRLQMEAVWDGKENFLVTVPSYRNDINAEIDLIEEIARVWGFDNFPKKGGAFALASLPDAPGFVFEQTVRQQALARGLQEFLTCDLIGPSLLEIVGVPLMPSESQIEVLNPTSVEQSVLRTSLLPGLLEVVKHNLDRKNHDLSGFEVGRIHFKEKGQYLEQTLCGILLTGKSRPSHWEEKPKEVDFYDLKGVVESLLNELKVSNYEFKKSNSPLFHPGRQASLYHKQMKLGQLGEVHPDIQNRLDVNQRILFAEIDLNLLSEIVGGDVMIAPLPLYPSSDRDWTVTLPKEYEVGDLLKNIQSFKSSLLESVDVKDVYTGSKVDSKFKNVTFHFVYRDVEKTVLQEVVDGEHARIISHFQERLGGKTCDGHK